MSVVIIETTASKVADEIVKEAAASDASSIAEWVRGEAAWALGTFARAALSIAATRIIWGVVFSNEQTKLIYERAGELLAYGKQERPYQRSQGAGFAGSYGRTSGPSPGAAHEDPFDFARHDHKRSNAEGAQVPPGAVYKGMAGEFPIYHHQTQHPNQQWPCPVLYRHPCETCAFMVADRSGRMWCAANEKLKLILSGDSDDRDLYEIRDFIKAMV